MAENKKSFVLYADYIEIFEELSDVDAGQLIKHILKYVNDESPVTENAMVKVSFIPIKQQLKRDLKKWEDFRLKQAEHGKKGGRPIKENNEKATLSEKTQPFLEESQKSLNVNANVNVIDINLSVNWEKLLNQFNEITGKKIKVISDKARRQIKARLKEGYSKDDVVAAITNCFNDAYHHETGHKYLTIEFISRPDKMEKYASMNADFKAKKQDRL